MNFREEFGKKSQAVQKGAKIYVWGTSGAWEKARRQYKVCAGINLEESVEAFIDNDFNKQGSTFYNLPVLSPNQISPVNAVVLIEASGKYNTEVGQQLAAMGFYHLSTFFEYTTFESFLRSWMYARLTKFKDKHKGQRCFIIGNGPSLKPDDLDLLKNEISFATNRIYLLFDKTVWRPTYYVVEDCNNMAHHEEFNQLGNATKFFDTNIALRYPDLHIENAYYFCSDYRVYNRPYPNKPLFSADDIEILYHAASISYHCLQIATYMGFSDIYLLGMDHDIPVRVTHDGVLIRKENLDGHFTKNYTAKHNFYYGPIYLLDLAFEVARDYADSHGIRIRNATRGGALEIFERVDFDSLFKKR